MKKSIIPEIWTDGCKNVSVTGEGLAIVHLHDNVGQLGFIVQSFELLENGAGMHSVYAVVGRARGGPILYL